MMRKDVKLGFAIGGVLLAVLVVYVLTVPAGDEQAEQVSLDTTGAVTEASGQSQTPTQTVEPAPVRPIKADTAPAKPIEPVTVAPSPKAEIPTEQLAGPTTQTAPSPQASADAGEDRWAMVLNRGLPVMMTTTPEPQAPAARPAAPATPDASSSNATAATRNNDSQVATAANRAAVANNTSSAELLQARADMSQTSVNKTHIVKAGETFASIAQATYGEASYFSHLMRANPSIDPRKLRPGMTINLPAITDVRAVASDTAVNAPAADVKLDEKTQYRVQSGDSLYKISLKLYGKADRADKIYELNKAEIGADPAKLNLNAVLKLPEAPVQQTARQ